MPEFESAACEGCAAAYGEEALLWGVQAVKATGHPVAFTPQTSMGN